MRYLSIAALVADTASGSVTGLYDLVDHQGATLMVISTDHGGQYVDVLRPLNGGRDTVVRMMHTA